MQQFCIRRHGGRRGRASPYLETSRPGSRQSQIPRRHSPARRTDNHPAAETNPAAGCNATPNACSSPKVRLGLFGAVFTRRQQDGRPGHRHIANCGLQCGPDRHDPQRIGDACQFHIDNRSGAISVPVQAVERIEECHRRITQYSRNPRFQPTAHLVNGVDAHLVYAS